LDDTQLARLRVLLAKGHGVVSQMVSSGTDLAGPASGTKYMRHYAPMRVVRSAFVDAADA